jgi:hypothetical protein
MISCTILRTLNVYVPVIVIAGVTTAAVLAIPLGRFAFDHAAALSTSSPYNFPTMEPSPTTVTNIVNVALLIVAPCGMPSVWNLMPPWA